ncbi:MAG: putative phosphotransferase [Solirubrobacterales bacterium]|nr:putative phosphotransferase [Solirubrobacterales bacterium]
MDLPARPDPDDRRAPLERWLATKLPEASDAAIQAISGTPGAGFVNETLLVDVAWTDRSGPRTAGYVVRLQPSEYTVLFQAREFFEPQYRLMRSLRERTDVPVPAVHWFEDDPSWLGAPFFVMSKIEGQTLPDVPPYFLSGWLHDAAPEQQAQTWWSTVEALAKVNRLDWRAAGLDFVNPDRPQAPGLAQRLDYYRSAYEWAREGAVNPIVEATMAWLQRNQPTPEEPVALCWGDARPGNMVYEDFSVSAVLDWEMASLGPPLQDLGWWFFMHRAFFGDLHTGDPDSPVGLPGFPSRDETIARWEELTGFSGAAIAYHEVFAGYRMAVHLQRMGSLFRRFGVVEPESQWSTNNLATQALAPLIGVDHPEPEPMPAIFAG